MTVQAAMRGVSWVADCETPLRGITGCWHGEVVPDVRLSEDLELDTVGGLTWSAGGSIVSDDGAASLTRCTIRPSAILE